MKTANKNTWKNVVITSALIFIPLILSIHVSGWFMSLWIILLGIGAGKILKK